MNLIVADNKVGKAVLGHILPHTSVIHSTSNSINTAFQQGRSCSLPSVVHRYDQNFYFLKPDLSTAMVDGPLVGQWSKTCRNGQPSMANCVSCGLFSD